MVQADAFALEPFHHVEHLVERFQIGRHFRDLRADMAVDADHFEVRQCSRGAVGRQYVLERHAELVALETR
ncbi:hypothetical protein D3C85_1858160 [compost metagenome]